METAMNYLPRRDYRSITRPVKATDVRIKRRIFNDCTGNGDFEFSVDPTNLF